MANNTLIAIGEALIDFIPNKSNCEFYDVENFTPAVGGAPANVCAAFSKLGGCSKIITQLGNDPFGDKITRVLKQTEIDTSCITYTDEANTALAFVSLSKDGNRTFSFYRKPSADMLLNPSKIKYEWFSDIFALHFCSVSIGNFPMRDSHIKAIEYAKANNAIISFDPNLRFPLWNSKDDLKKAVHHFLPMADILKISDEELEFITGESSIEKALPMLFKNNVKLVIYTCGKEGAYAFTRSAKAFAPSIEVKVFDTTGAGDGFIGSFLWKLKELGFSKDNIEELKENDIKQLLEFSNKFCSVSVQIAGAINSYPTINDM